MKKKIIIFLTVFIVLLALILNVNTLRSSAKSLLSAQLKERIKSFLLGKKTMDYYNTLRVKSSINYNQKLLPNSEFIELSFNDFLLTDLITDDEHSIKRKYYIEQFNDDLIIVDDIANIFFINKDIIKNEKNFKSIKAKSNLISENKKVKDVLVVNNEIYVSYSEIKSEDCQNIGIAKAKISKEKINFINFFESNECVALFNAGRMELYNHNNKKGLLFTTDASGTDKQLAQDDNSLFGKLLFIDFKNKVPIVFSKGHRTAQGLLIDNDNIITTEHGPRGGDEINLIKFGNNYGWPIASYGEPYFYQEKNMKIIHYLKNHDENGFIEPIFSFVPSIGISQIIKVPENFSNHWSDSYLVASLAGKVIYRVKLDKNLSKLIYYEKIFIGKRIRDMIYLKDYNVFILALEGFRAPDLTKTPSLGILGFKNFLTN